MCAVQCMIMPLSSWPLLLLLLCVQCFRHVILHAQQYACNNTHPSIHTDTQARTHTHTHTEGGPSAGRPGQCWGLPLHSPPPCSSVGLQKPSDGAAALQVAVERHSTVNRVLC